MPCEDATGPMGQGKMTGRGNGPCAGAGGPDQANPAQTGRQGRGGGRGRMGGQGAGRGGGNRMRCRGGARGMVDPCQAPATSELIGEEEVDVLKRQAENLRKAQENVAKRIQELETPQTD